MKGIFLAIPAFLATVSTAAGGAWAAAGRPVPWQVGMQDMVTPVGDSGADFHTMLVWIITVIAFLVLGLMLYVIVRFNAKANPTPSKTTHNTLLEVAWTVLPIIILVAIAIPSFRLLYFQNTVPADTDLTITATGHQWYWSYAYPDHGDFSFDSNLLAKEDLKDGQPYLLAVDNAIVVPVGKIVRVLVTAADVLHAFAVPSFYLKVDAVPGRYNEIWFQATKEGTYYGQCSELCGSEHGYMPIEVRVVSEDAFDRWVAKAKVKFARRDDGMPAPTKLAAANLSRRAIEE